MSDPIEHPKKMYAELPPEEREFVDKMLTHLFEHAQKLPSLKRLSPEKARETAIGLVNLGLLRIQREKDSAWWEIYDGKSYVRV